jgi:hypothetical protein
MVLQHGYMSEDLLKLYAVHAECEFDGLAINKNKCGVGFNQLWIVSL